MFSRILIANRGEIACRVIRTARRLGIRTVAVYSDADAHARHVRLADEAVRIGPAAARESYLVAERILAAAQDTGAEAVHPGYGFLSENAGFAEACVAGGIAFIGPPASAIRAMGSKSAAKALMAGAGVPLVPGYHGERQEEDFLAREAGRIGYPLLIKASAGGGGKGMRIVERQEDFAAALASCQREAASSFGDARVLIEKYLVRPRHIEMQVFGDTQGHCVHLFERDCSVQRRYQKVLEEAPAPGMTPERRTAMGRAAVDAARAVGYVGAGTVEFIAEQDGTFYFMEMNTRLQVEHPVTEMITGLDLVEWQLRVAAGEPLPLAQEQIRLRGHALEARIYAEDPDRGFLPSTGRLLHLRTPQESECVRIDSGVEEGDEITPHYDPMIAKLIVWDAGTQDPRSRALARMHEALASFQIAGVSNNVDFLGRLVTCESFAAAQLDTGLIERERAFLFPPSAVAPREVFLVAALAELLGEAEQGGGAHRSPDDAHSPWQIRDGWRLNATLQRTLRFCQGELQKTVEVTYAADSFLLMLDGRATPARARRQGAHRFRAGFDGRSLPASVVAAGERRHIFFSGRSWTLTRINPLRHAGTGADEAGGLMAPMPGKVIALLAESGSTVEAGTPLLILEAMKMEHTIAAPAKGLLRSFRFGVGDSVPEGAQLVEFEAAT